MTAKRKRSPRDLFGSKRKGTEMAITVDAELMHILDDFRSQTEEMTGCVLSRRQVLEGLLRKVWRQQLIEASVLGAAGVE